MSMTEPPWHATHPDAIDASNVPAAGRVMPSAGSRRPLLRGDRCAALGGQPVPSAAKLRLIHGDIDHRLGTGGEAHHAEMTAPAELLQSTGIEPSPGLMAASIGAVRASGRRKGVHLFPTSSYGMIINRTYNEQKGASCLRRPIL